MATMLNGSGMLVKVDNLDKFFRSLDALVKTEVLVGFPEETTERKEDEDQDPVTNAALAYIHDNGMPSENIPARPFMLPAMDESKDRVEASLLSMSRKATNPKTERVEEAIHQGFHRVGLIAQAALRAKINEGIPPPLSEVTLRARAHRGGKGKNLGSRKGALQELENRARGENPSTLLAKPLVDTAQMRNAASYVVRSKANRNKER